MPQFADGDCLGIEWRSPDQRVGPLRLTTLHRGTQGLCIGCDKYDLRYIDGYTVRYWEREGFELDGYDCEPENADARLRAFVRYVCYCLDLLYLSPTGRALLDDIQGSCAIKDHRVVITPSYLGANQYRVAGPSMCSVSSALRSSKEGIPEAVKTALAAAYPNLGARERLSALFTTVVEAPFASNHGYLARTDPVPDENLPTGDVQTLSTELATLNGGMDALTEERFLAWLVTRKPDRLRACGDSVVQNAVSDHLTRAVITTLYSHSEASVGSHVAVDFAPGVYARNEEEEEKVQRQMMVERPPVVGLAHELVHALYVVKGMQPDQSDTNVVLTEMACVGLGPWLGSKVSDNRIRNEWMVPEMRRRAALLAEDPVNQREHPVQRPYYAWDELSYLEGELKRNPRFRPHRWGGSASEGLVCTLCKAGGRNTLHGSRRSTLLGRWHRCTGCRKVYCNYCGKWHLSRSSWGSRTRQCPCGKETKLIE